MSESESIEVLRLVKAKLGRNYKSKIREAWMDGNYRGVMLDEWSSQLQRIRNVFGPSWLIKARV